MAGVDRDPGQDPLPCERPLPPECRLGFAQAQFGPGSDPAQRQRFDLGGLIEPPAGCEQLIAQLPHVIDSIVLERGQPARPDRLDVCVMAFWLELLDAAGTRRYAAGKTERAVGDRP